MTGYVAPIIPLVPSYIYSTARHLVEVPSGLYTDQNLFDWSTFTFDHFNPSEPLMTPMVGSPTLLQFQGWNNIPVPPETNNSGVVAVEITAQFQPQSTPSVYKLTMGSDNPPLEAVWLQDLAVTQGNQQSLSVESTLFSNPAIGAWFAHNMGAPLFVTVLVRAVALVGTLFPADQ